VYINKQPFFVRIPGAFLFYLGKPFFIPEKVFIEGSFIWRNALKCVWSIIFAFYFKFLVQGTLYCYREGSLLEKILVFSTIFIFLMLSQASLQMRHKVMVMPLFYIFVSYGFYKNSGLEREIGWAAFIGVLLVNTLKFIVGI
jgi:hypothetical protein